MSYYRPYKPYRPRYYGYYPRSRRYYQRRAIWGIAEAIGEPLVVVGIALVELAWERFWAGVADTEAWLDRIAGETWHILVMSLPFTLAAATSLIIAWVIVSWHRRRHQFDWLYSPLPGAINLPEHERRFRRHH